jgi:PEP-CTERM motif
MPLGGARALAGAAREEQSMRLKPQYLPITGRGFRGRRCAVNRHKVAVHQHRTVPGVPMSHSITPRPLPTTGTIVRSRGRRQGKALALVLAGSLSTSMGLSAQTFDAYTVVDVYVPGQSVVRRSEPYTQAGALVDQQRLVARPEDLDGEAQGLTSISVTMAPGRMGLFTQSTASLTTPQYDQSVGVWGEASATIADRFIVSCPTCVVGSVGWLTVKLRFDGQHQLEAQVPPSASDNTRFFGSAGWGTSFSMQAQNVPWEPSPDPYPSPDPSSISRSMWQRDFHDNDGTDQEGRYFEEPESLTVAFVFGQPVDFQWSATVNTLAMVLPLSQSPSAGVVSGWSMSQVDRAHAFIWDGITVQDSSYQPVSGYVARNANGLDYAQSFAVAAVPEPGTWLLMGTGVALLSLVARRRRQGPPLETGSPSSASAA